MANPEHLEILKQGSSSGISGEIKVQRCVQTWPGWTSATRAWAGQTLRRRPTLVCAFWEQV